MPVKHGRVRTETQLVCQPCRIQPLLAVNLVVADDRPHASRKDLGAAARHGVDTRIAQFHKRVFDGELGAAGKERHLDHGERLDVHLGKPLLQPADQIQKILQREVGMEPADNVKLRNRLGVSGGRRLPGLFERHGVPGRIALLAAEGAELASRHANIRGIDMAIDVEIGHIAMHLFPHIIRKPANSQHVLRPVERDSVFKAEPLPGKYLRSDRLERWVIRSEGML